MHLCFAQLKRHQSRAGGRWEGNSQKCAVGRWTGDGNGLGLPAIPAKPANREPTGQSWLLRYARTELSPSAQGLRSSNSPSNRPLSSADADGRISKRLQLVVVVVVVVGWTDFEVVRRRHLIVIITSFAAAQNNATNNNNNAHNCVGLPHFFDAVQHADDDGDARATRSACPTVSDRPPRPGCQRQSWRRRRLRQSMGIISRVVGYLFDPMDRRRSASNLVGSRSDKTSIEEEPIISPPNTFAYVLFIETHFPTLHNEAAIHAFGRDV